VVLSRLLDRILIDPLTFRHPIIYINISIKIDQLSAQPILLLFTRIFCYLCGMSTPELLAPGGSLSHAWHALSAGADAVYIGAKDFSARANAKNLELEEIRALCGFAAANGKQVYAALNTLVRDTELGKFIELAWQLHLAGVNALIVQDFGAIGILTQDGPPICLHASTQMAIHNTDGCRLLADFGVSRAVLARELTLTEIQTIRQACPDTELEVFIHGAMCYSVSGLCLASGHLLGRSANRGNCAQICRTWFAGSVDNCTSAHFASMHDLSVAAQVRQLASIGVNSLKIEGRMKSPGWLVPTVRAYRQFLNNTNGNPQLDAAAQQHLLTACAVFGRNSSNTYLQGAKSGRLVEPSFPGSTGVAIGPISKVQGKNITVESKTTLATGDGLQILRPVAGTDRLESVRFSVTSCTPSATNLRIAASEALNQTDLGLILHQVSRHNALLPEIAAQSLQAYRFKFPLDVTIKEQTLALNTPLFGTFSQTYPVNLTPSTQDRDIATIIAGQFKQSGCMVTADPCKVKNHSGIANPFLQPSVLKNIKRQWYQALTNHLASFIQIEPAQPAQLCDIPASLRYTMSPLGEPDNEIGFVSRMHLLNIDKLPQSPVLAGFIPLKPCKTFALNPFLPDCEQYKAALLAFMKSNPAFSFLVGLNNAAHIQWFKAWSENAATANIELYFYVDYGFHNANSHTAVTLQKHLQQKIIARVPWLERENSQATQTSTAAEYVPPLFISRACMIRNANNAQHGKCPPGCSGNTSFLLRQPNKNFKVMIIDCINYLLETSKT